MGKILWEAIIFITFILICGGLIKRRFSKFASLLSAGGTLLIILLIQTALILSGQDITLMLTMLPLTAYLPAIICLHILSRSNFFQTMSIWTVGAMTYFILKILWKILICYFGRFSGLSGWIRSFIISALLILMSAFLLWLVLGYIRKSFQKYVFSNQTNWLLLSFPIIMIFLLFLYFGNSTTNVTILLLLLLTSISILLVLSKVIVSSATISNLKEAEKAVALQMQMQRREYEQVCKKMEMGRAYRHDMRHHLLVLEGLVKQGETKSMIQYIKNLNGQLSDIENKVYCENTTINAVLSSCIGQASKAKCDVKAKISLPKDIPFDEIDICVIMANALDNAINACCKIDDISSRYIRITADFIDGRKLIISVDNPCNTPMSFNDQGFPIVPEWDGHGIGLKSIDTVAKKYHGTFHCEYKEGKFSFKAVMFNQPSTSAIAKKRSYSKELASLALTCFTTFFLIVNCVPSFAQAMGKLPVLSTLVQLADLKSYNFYWGDTSFKAEIPELKAGKALPQQEPELNNVNSSDNLPQKSNELAPDFTPLPDDNIQAEPKTEIVIEEESNTISYPISDLSDYSTILKPSTNTTKPLIEAKPSAETESETRPQKPDDFPGLETKPVSYTAEPSPDDVDDAVDDINEQMEHYISQMQEKFLWYVARKYEGYVAMDTTYNILRNDEVLLSIRFETTINVGGSGQYSRCFTLDKRTATVLELSDLFLQKSDYIGIISADILKQMTEQVNSGTGDYFIPGGIWSDDECFKQIEADQNFYINNQNQLVIIFDEYQVAPGSMGMPEFVLTANHLNCLRISTDWFWPLWKTQNMLNMS